MEAGVVPLETLAREQHVSEVVGGKVGIPLRACGFREIAKAEGSIGP